MAVDLVTAGILGAGGGILRALVGFGKASSDKKKFNPSHFVITSIIGIIIGIVVGMILNFSWQFALVAGYAGTDVLEGIAKMFRSGKAYGLVRR